MSPKTAQAPATGCGPFLETVADIREAEKRPVDAENFCATLSVNVDNDQLSDRDFRAFVRNSLPIVRFPRPGAGRAEAPA